MGAIWSSDIKVWKYNIGVNGYQIFLQVVDGHEKADFLGKQLFWLGAFFWSMIFEKICDSGGIRIWLWHNYIVTLIHNSDATLKLLWQDSDMTFWTNKLIFFLVLFRSTAWPSACAETACLMWRQLLSHSPQHAGAHTHPTADICHAY